MPHLLGFSCSCFLSLFLFKHSADVAMLQLFPDLDKVVFIDDDVVIQRDLSPLWEMDLNGKVNGAVETCKGDDDWVMSKHFRNYFNFSHPLIAKSLDPDECAWAYGMNIFDLSAWRKTDIRDTYHTWLKEVSTILSLLICLLLFCLPFLSLHITMGLRNMCLLSWLVIIYMLQFF